MTDERKVYGSPMEAFKHDACCICLGSGQVFNVYHRALIPCRLCKGDGTVATMWETIELMADE
jgi:hypothetical protein